MISSKVEKEPGRGDGAVPLMLGQPVAVAVGKLLLIRKVE
jgi:hypothetical protein